MPSSLRRACLGAALVLLAAGGAQAKGASGDSQAADRAYCNSADYQGDRKACLREAAAVRGKAGARHTTSSGNTDYQANALRRCERQPEDARAACAARVQEAGSGSVQGGGILREHREVITSPAPAASH